MLGEDQPRAGRQLDRRNGRRPGRPLVTSRDHAACRLDANPVGRARVGDPPRALVEPYFAMPAARVGPVDHDVAALALADGIATAWHNGHELDAANAARILDLDRERLRGERRLRAARPRRTSVARVRRHIELRPAPEERYAIGTRDALRRS